uniref:Uncharacterized protein n=1 Tax=Pseudictyota dubia TaxID=2749911 RepID=A0A7R9WE20_9STRA|mmetsp:Transcript_46568/g.86513  ORF Transcript_46568/g.86513 Transcript_46568/m.86513 type:complete len:357 (+) Transcript_46568:175-1245(+)|eukprot:CAMPEP_0197457490 /NCGR_PEP_ID=MMETSP1175-20131217/46205_1 /TAXON_ID=1003142 /ORGANISM="Triceratium dubium, Strain CCMP147" /LENGTH=356 /DNA_ID=CAMNT_0042991877 /DNA_START=171 /DNA_END=1241 /DNA_ORIENTATION=+
MAKLAAIASLSMWFGSVTVVKSQAPLTNEYKNFINRIEYQIPMSKPALQANGNDVEGNIDNFIDWVVELNTTDDFMGKFRLLKDTKERVYRRKHEVSLEKANCTENCGNAPRASSFKYREPYNSPTIGFGDKRQKDLSWEITLSTKGKDADWASINSTSEYFDIYGTKVEANVFADPCAAKENGADVQTRNYLDEPTGFTGKIEFDDDLATYGNLTIDTSDWDTIGMTALCTQMESYYIDACDYYKMKKLDNNMDTRLRSNIQYVVDVDFEIMGENSTNWCEGKFTWQVRYDTDDNVANGIVHTSSTELSLKLKTKKCDKADEGIDWASNVALGEKLVDYIAINAEWIRNRDNYCA